MKNSKMKTSVKKIAAIILALALALSLSVMLAACNDNNENVITIGYTVYPPMNYENSDGSLTGFDTDLARAVFESLGYKVIFKEINWENKYVDLNTGNIDCIWNGFTSNADDNGVPRNQSVDFSYNYMLNAQAVVINKTANSGITDIASLAGKIGYVEAGSAGASYAEENFTNATIKTATKQMDAIAQVLSNSAQFACVDLLLAESLAGKGDYANIEIADALTSEEEFYAIGFKKGSDFTAKVNEKLVALAADGTISKIAAKYNLENAVITDFSSQQA